MHWIKTLALIWLLVGTLSMFAYGLPMSAGDVIPTTAAAQATGVVMETVATSGYSGMEVDVPVTLISPEDGDVAVAVSLVWLDPAWFEEAGQDETPAPIFVLERDWDNLDWPVTA